MSSVRIGMLTALAPAAAIVAVAPLIVQVLLGDPYASTSGVLSMQVVAMGFAATAQVLGQGFVAAGRTWVLVAGNAISGVIFLVNVAIWVPVYGALGMAMANAIEYSFHLMMFLVLARRLLGKYAVELAIAAVVCGAILVVLITVSTSLTPPSQILAGSVGAVCVVTWCMGVTRFFSDRSGAGKAVELSRR